MKKIISILLAALLLLSLAACAGPEEDGTTAAPEDPASSAASAETDRAPDHSYDPATDYDKRFSVDPWWGCFVEAEDVYYWAPDTSSSYVRYCDKQGGDWGVLCGKPECLHDEDNDCVIRQDCNGYLSGLRRTMWMYEGKLYYVTTDVDRDHRETCFAKVMRMDPDATNKELVMYIPRLYTSEGKEAQPQVFFFHRGRIFTYATAHNVSDAEPYTAVCAACIELSGTEFSVFYESLQEINAVQLFFAGDFVYLSASRWNFEELGERKLMRFDLTTWEKELLFQEKGRITFDLEHFWVTETGEIYALNDYEEGVGRTALLRLEDGVWNEVWRLEGDETGYELIAVADGVVLARNHVEFDRNGLDPDIDLLVKRFDGTTVCRGKLPMDWLEEMPENATLEYITTATGRETGLIFQFHLCERNATGSNQRQTFALVRCELAQDALTGILMGVMHSQPVRGH